MKIIGSIKRLASSPGIFFTLSVTLLTVLFLSSLAGAEPYYYFEKPTFNVHDLKNVISKYQITRVSALLKKLPQSMKSKAIIIFRSRSLQEASYLNPRILLFNEDASLVISFNGHPSQHGYEALEVMSFDHQNLKFNFEEFVFQEDYKKREEFLELKKLSEEIAALKNRGGRTGVNPQLCLTCHRSNPRPNWEPYPHWPGVYGQNDRDFGNEVSFQIGSVKVVVSKEYAQFEKFLISYRNNPRYSEISYFENIKLNPSNQSSLNSDFTQSLSNLNFLRLMGDIRCHPKFKFYDLDLSEIGPHFPGRKAPISFWEKISQIQRELEIRNFELTLEHITELKIDPNNAFESRHRSWVPDVQYILQNELNIDLGEYDMSFFAPTYHFGTPEKGFKDYFELQKLYKDKIVCNKN